MEELSGSGCGRQRERLPNIPMQDYNEFKTKDLNLIKVSQVLVREGDKRATKEVNIIYLESHIMQVIELGSNSNRPHSEFSQKGNTKKICKLYLVLLLMLYQLISAWWSNTFEKCQYKLLYNIISQRYY